MAEEDKILRISKRYLISALLINILLSILFIIPAFAIAGTLVALGSNGSDFSGEQVGLYALYIVIGFFIIRVLDIFLYFFRSKLENLADGLEMSKGGFILEKVIVPRSIMAISHITQNPLEAILGLAKIEIRTPTVKKFKGVSYSEAENFSKSFKGNNSGSTVITN